MYFENFCLPCFFFLTLILLKSTCQLFCSNALPTICACLMFSLDYVEVVHFGSIWGNMLNGCIIPTFVTGDFNFENLANVDHFVVCLNSNVTLVFSSSELLNFLEDTFKWADIVKFTHTFTHWFNYPLVNLICNKYGGNLMMILFISYL